MKNKQVLFEFVASDQDALCREGVTFAATSTTTPERGHIGNYGRGVPPTPGGMWDSMSYIEDRTRRPLAGTEVGVAQC